MRTTLLALSFALVAGCATSGGVSPLAGSRQLIVVVSPAWDATAARMQRYERSSESAVWRAAGEPVPVILGRGGLAWGAGLHAAQKEGPVKREGDGKSPAGVFHLGSAFGFGEPPAPTRLPYLELRDTIECVDDSSSAFYNRIVDGASVSPVDWSSSEKMRSVGQYRRGVVVQHNTPPRRNGGSCIFLHVNDPSARPTAGCTAMDLSALEALMRWVDPDAQPLLVQLTETEYARLRASWQLP